jgi:hypothetical protein
MIDTDLGFSKAGNIVLPKCSECIRSDLGARFWNGDDTFLYNVPDFNFWCVLERIVGSR